MKIWNPLSRILTGILLFAWCATGYSQEATTATAEAKPETTATETAAKPAPKKKAKAAKPAPKAKLCVERIHVIYGCKTCESMMEWLKKGGVKIEMSDVQTGPYKLYPTIVYSDKSTDNGEKMYQHAAAIPEKICIIRCNVGTE